MARTTAVIAVPPQRVFDVLADARSYAEWVVGADAVRGFDPEWPAVGSRFHHRVGAGPLKVEDSTRVVAVEPPSRLVLHARARPLGTALVTLQLEPLGTGTRVTMIETAGDTLSHIGLNRVTDPLVHLRNVKSLERLRRIAERVPDEI